MSDVLNLCRSLIEVPSITPNDEGCQHILIGYLEALGFRITRLDCDPVSNFWAEWGDSGPLFAFAGHTDVVPTGPVDDWQSPPFEATIQDGQLVGRGVADMKGAIAAMCVAVRRFICANPKGPGRIGLIITSGEEGIHFTHGTPKIMSYLNEQGITVDACLVGEPSCQDILGDTIRVGRRGSLTGYVTFYGKQGHVAYPHLADNPIHTSVHTLQTLVNTTWDEGFPPFSPSSFQITKLISDSGAGNVIPGQVDCQFNFRFSPALQFETIKEQVETVIKTNHARYDLTWQLNGEPFLTSSDSKLVTCLQDGIQTITGQQAIHNTGGGTSDARFIAPYDIDVVEFGLCHASIHQINERSPLADLETLCDIYTHFLSTFF